MPVTKSAIKKLRVDRRRAVVNQRLKRRYRAAVKAMRDKPTVRRLAGAASALDRAAKERVIHRNKASRLKSRLARLVVSKVRK